MKKLRVRWKESSIEDFVSRHAAGLSGSHAFLPTARPLPEGTPVGFQFLLADGTEFLAGTATITEVRHAGSGEVPGMVLRFEGLSDTADAYLEQLRLRSQTVEVALGPEAIWAATADDREDLLSDDAPDTMPDAHPAGLRSRRPR